MAKAKAKKKQAELQDFDLNNVGDDFVDLPGGFGVSWNPENEGDTLEGRISEIKTGIEVKFGKETKEQDIMTVIDKTGLAHSVWKSATLSVLFSHGQALIGYRVRLTYLGLGAKKKGQNAPKLYKVQLAK